MNHRFLYSFPVIEHSVALPLRPRHGSVAWQDTVDSLQSGAHHNSLASGHLYATMRWNISATGSSGPSASRYEYVVLAKGPDREGCETCLSLGVRVGEKRGWGANYRLDM